MVLQFPTRQGEVETDQSEAKENGGLSKGFYRSARKNKNKK